MQLLCVSRWNVYILLGKLLQFFVFSLLIKHMLTCKNNQMWYTDYNSRLWTLPPLGCGDLFLEAVNPIPVLFSLSLQSCNISHVWSVLASSYTDISSLMCPTAVCSCIDAKHSSIHVSPLCMGMITDWKWRHILGLTYILTI